MKVITAVEEYIPSNDEISVFLAGGTHAQSLTSIV